MINIMDLRTLAIFLLNIYHRIQMIILTRYLLKLIQISFYRLYKYFLTNKTDKEKYVKNKLKMNPIKIQFKLIILL